MFGGIKSGFSLFGATIGAVSRYPVLLLPLIFVWACYAPMVVYLYFYFDWKSATALQGLGAIFGFIFTMSVLLSAACFILLEQIRLIETGESLKWFSPVLVAAKNVWRALPVTLTWAIIWLLITIVEMLIRRQNSGHDTTATPENIARALGGDGQISISAAFFEALKKGVRMIAFLIFPAVAWENHPRPIRRGLAVARSHKTEFATGFALTEIAAAIVFLPPAIIFIIADNTDIVISDGIWFSVIIYSGFAWSISLLLEQLFTAELYLWDLKWREACSLAERAGKPIPRLAEVPRASIMDDRADLLPT